MRLSERLPDTPAWRHVAGQILRSGTSPAPNYGEAHAAKSRGDFVHKIGVVAKEMNETVVLVTDHSSRSHVKPALLDHVLDEGQQLAKIVTRSHHIARTRRPMKDDK